MCIVQYVHGEDPFPKEISFLSIGSVGVRVIRLSQFTSSPAAPLFKSSEKGGLLIHDHRKGKISQTAQEDAVL